MRIVLGFIIGTCLSWSAVAEGYVTSSTIEEAATALDEDTDVCALWETETEFTSFTYELRLDKGTRIPMRMPSSYFCGSERRDGLTYTAQLFWLSITDFTPLRCDPDEPSAGNDWISLRLSDKVSQPEKLRIRLGLRSGTKAATYERQHQQYGLTEYSNYPNDQINDVYSSGSPSNTDVIIACTSNVNLPSSICNMLLEINDIDITVGFHRRELSNWRIIQRRVSNFASCAISNKE